MTECVLIFPHQLFRNHPGLMPGRRVYLIEHPLYFSQYRFHGQKLMLHRASMRAYAAMLTQEGYDVSYIDHSNAREGVRSLNASAGCRWHVAEVVDDWLERDIRAAAADIGSEIVWYDTPQFLTTDAQVRDYWARTKRRTNHAFYVWQRKRLSVLYENGEPVGGAWSFDADNRKPLPKDIELPSAYTHECAPWVEEARTYVTHRFPKHYGSTASFAYSVTHAGAQDVLAQFLAERIDTFGPYEDAMSSRGHELFHSVLSPYLNIGLLTPEQVLAAVLAHARTHEVPLPSLEGFIRQLIGWREFIRMVYVCDGRRMRSRNDLRATRTLSSAWWDGTTGLYPIDQAIAVLKTHAYTHHIIRLMVLGNSMTLMGVHPDEAHRWFMEWYIDAYDWVMVPNVYGMALYADSGSMVTKPYISGSRYIRSMSDYPSGDWTKEWDALYWAFVEKHRTLLAQNPRTALTAAALARFTHERVEAYRTLAQDVCRRITV